MAKQNIFTPTDRQNVLREQIENDQIARMKKEMGKLLKEPEFWDDCPYCKEFVTFKNDDKAKHEKIGKSDYLIIQCPKCSKEVYHFLKIEKNGDMLNGITYDPVVRVMTKEFATYQPEQVSEKFIKVKFEPKGEK